MAEPDSAASANPQPATSSIIEQSVIAAFEPQRVLMLRQDALSSVRQQPGAAIVRGIAAGDDGTRKQLLVGAEMPISNASLQNKDVYFTFFLIGSSDEFAATPVANWTASQLMQNQIQLAELVEDQAELSLELESNQAALVKVDDELAKLRERASQIAGVDDIIDLKMKLLRVKGFGEDYAAEKERLRRLVDLGRKLDEPENSKLRIQELSSQLYEAAKATAMADRLNTRRREAARSSLDQKIALVQEMRSVDATALAREVLRLRAERKEIERASVASDTTDSDF